MNLQEIKDAIDQHIDGLDRDKAIEDCEDLIAHLEVAHVGLEADAAREGGG